MHEDMQVSSKTPVSGIFYLRGSRLVKFHGNPRTLIIPKKRGPIMHPDPLFKIHRNACFPKICPDYHKSLPGYEKFSV